jgi:hypothetical protein
VWYFLGFAKRPGLPFLARYERANAGLRLLRPQSSPKTSEGQAATPPTPPKKNPFSRRQMRSHNLLYPVHQHVSDLIVYFLFAIDHGTIWRIIGKDQNLRSRDLWNDR